REQPAVVADSREIRSGMAVLPEDRPPAIATLDRAIQVVPLVDPANGRIRALLLVEIRQRLAERDLAEQREGSVEDRAIGVAGYDEIPHVAHPHGLQAI